MGAQWVHGIEGNVVYELAAPHGVLDKGDGEPMHQMHEKVMDSEGNVVNENDIKDVNQFTDKVEEELVEHAKENKNSPLGDYYENKYEFTFLLILYK